MTEARVIAASQRLLTGRTGVLVAHRLSTTERAEQVAVMESGRLVQQGARQALPGSDGPFRRLLEAASVEADIASCPVEPARQVGQVDGSQLTGSIGSARRTTSPPPPPQVAPAPSLARASLRALLVEPRWGLVGMVLFFVYSLTGAFGALTSWAWGHVIVTLQAGGRPVWLTVAVVVSLLISPLLIAQALRIYPLWWVGVLLRVRTAVLYGQTRQHRLAPTPPGEVVARTMDAERLARYADRWVDVVNGLVVVVLAGIIAGSWLAAGVLLAVMLAAALASSFGRSVAGRSAAAASAARARFGRSLVSALESARTVKLAGATGAIHTHLRHIDAGRVQAAVREHRVQTLLDGIPAVMVAGGVVAAWAGLLGGPWGLATAILLANAVAGFGWFGRVAGAVVTEAPGTRAWMVATSDLAGGASLTDLPEGVDLVAGTGPNPGEGVRDPLQVMSLRGVSAIHDDGTVGALQVDLDVRRGELVLLLGQVGAGKSSLLGALAGLVSSTGEIRWNDTLMTDPERDLRPGRVAYVAQVPRVLSGTFADNVRLRHRGRRVERPLALARLTPDVADAGGPDALVGHRGVRLSGGQVQRLALARALACEAELLLADDVSSALDATTEVELWNGLRERGATVIGATSKAAALARADRVVVLVDGRVADVGPWSALEPAWRHLAG